MKYFETFLPFVIIGSVEPALTVALEVSVDGICTGDDLVLQHELRKVGYKNVLFWIGKTESLNLFRWEISTLL